MAPKKTNNEPTKTMNIRDVPDALYWKCKERAAQQRLSLREFVILALEQMANGESPPQRRRS